MRSLTSLSLVAACAYCLLVKPFSIHFHPLPSKPVKDMSIEEGHRSTPEAESRADERPNTELNAMADIVSKAVATSIQEALQPLIHMLPGTAATPTAGCTGEKPKEAPPSGSAPGTSGKQSL